MNKKEMTFRASPFAKLINQFKEKKIFYSTKTALLTFFLLK